MSANDADVNLLCCLPVTTAHDASVEHTHFILQPTRMSNAAEKCLRHIQDMSINDADANHLCCLQVATTLDVAVKRTHFFLQPIQVSDADEKFLRHVLDMSVNDAAIKLLYCLRITTTVDAVAKRGEAGYEFRRDNDDDGSCSRSDMRYNSSDSLQCVFIDAS